MMAVVLALFGAAPAIGAVAPSLGTAQSFAVLAASAITNTGPTVVTGDLGISPNNAGSVTGFPPGAVLGTTHFADGVSLGAQNDVTLAYNSLASQPCDATIATDLGGLTLLPGVYCSASSAGLTGALTLDAQGDPGAVFVFKVGSTFTTASGASVVLANGAQACNVFWQIGSSATLGTGTAFAGSLLALVSNTLTTGATVNGRVLARTGAVTMDTNSVSVCSLATASPTVAISFLPPTIVQGASAVLTVTLTDPGATPATLLSPLVVGLPSGLVVASQPAASTTCGGSGAATANPGASSATLAAGRIIPASAACTMTFGVTASGPGPYVTSLPAGSLVTSAGSSAAATSSTLTVLAVGAGPGDASAAIPTLSESMLALMMLIMAAAGGHAIASRRS